MKFDKQSTLLIKGIAIVLMVCNHLFPILEWIYPENEYVSIPFGGKTIAAYVGGFSKICVALFALLTGIAMYHAYSRGSVREGYRHTLKKLPPFFLTYWMIILCVYIPVMAAVGVFTFDFREFVLNLLGYMTTYCKIAWYVRFYLELVVLFPLVVITMNFLFKIVKSKEISIVIFLSVNWCFRFVFLHLAMPSMNLIIEFLRYLPVVVMGYYIAWASVFERVAVKMSDTIKSRIVLLILYIIVFSGIFLLRGLLTGNSWFTIDVILAPIFIGCTWYLFAFFKDSILIRNTEQCLNHFGRYSLEIWFLHAIFFIGDARIQKIAYWPKLDIFILIWTLILLFPFAVIIQCLRKKILPSRS